MYISIDFNKPNDLMWMRWEMEGSEVLLNSDKYDRKRA